MFDAKSGAGTPPLVSVCGDHDLDTLESLLDLPTDRDMTSDGVRAMHVAAISGHFGLCPFAD